MYTPLGGVHKLLRGMSLKVFYNTFFTNVAYFKVIVLQIVSVL